jgi:hypothetical protein
MTATTDRTGIDCRDGFSGEPYPCHHAAGKLHLHRGDLGRTLTLDAATPAEARATLRAMGYRVAEPTGAG